MLFQNTWKTSDIPIRAVTGGCGVKAASLMWHKIDLIIKSSLIILCVNLVLFGV
jgi:hypothetical protein